MSFKSYMRKYILKYIVFISVFCVAFCSWSLPASADFITHDQFQDHISLSFLNLYVLPEGATDINQGQLINLNDLYFTQLDDSKYALNFRIDPSFDDSWTLGRYYTALLIFNVKYFDLVTNFGVEALENFKYDSFSCNVSGRWLPTDDLPANYTSINKILRHYYIMGSQDKDPYILNFPGSVSYPGNNSIDYSLPVFDWDTYTDGFHNYEIYLYFTFENDYSSNGNLNYRFVLSDLVYSAGSNENQVSIYPSFDDSALTDFENKESAAVGSAMDSFNSVKDSVFDFSIIDQNTEAYKGYVAVSKLVSKFIDIPFVGNLVKFSVLFGVLALVVGIASNVIGRSKR